MADESGGDVVEAGARRVSWSDRSMIQTKTLTGRKKDRSSDGTRERRRMMMFLIAHRYIPHCTCQSFSNPFSFTSFRFPYFISFPSVRQIIISLSARPREISSTPERSVRIIRICQPFDSPLRTNGTDTLTTPCDGIGLEGCNVSICFIAGWQRSWSTKAPKACHHHRRTEKLVSG